VDVPNPTRQTEIPEKYRDTVTRGLEYLAKEPFKEATGGDGPSLLWP